jgi:uncharacterized phiE125 gp8 family phage protein
MASTPPSAPPEPLTLEEVKHNLRVDDNDDDVSIEALIADAREYVERESGQVLVPRLITETATDARRGIDLASWPVRSIEEIRYPLAGAMTVLPISAWQAGLKRRPVRVIAVIPGWRPRSEFGRTVRDAMPIEIDVEAGYATPADVPRVATRAMHMLIGHWFSNRSGVESGARAAAIEVPLGVTSLIEQLQLARV